MLPSTVKQFQKGKFDARSKEWDKRFVYLPFWVAFERETLARWIEEVEEESVVLDVGCGTGRSIIPLARRACRVVGLDISKHMLMLAKRKATSKRCFSKVDLVVGDSEAMPFVDASFGAIASCGLLSCLPRPYIALDEMLRVSKKNGLLFAFELNGYRFETCQELYASLLPRKLLFFKAKKKNSEKITLDIPCRLFVEEIERFMVERGAKAKVSTKVLVFLPLRARRLQSLFHRNYALSRLWLSLDRGLEKIPSLKKRGKYLVLDARKRIAQHA